MKTTYKNGMLFLILLIILSSCFDFAPDFGSWGMGGWGSGYGGSYYGPGYYDPQYTAFFGVDSIVQNTDSTATIWAYIRYDSTLIIKQQILSYWKEPYDGVSVITDSVLVEPDTIKFKTLPDSLEISPTNYIKVYKYQMPVTHVDAEFRYMFCLLTQFQEKGIEGFINNFCITNK